MAEPLVRLERQDGIATLTLSNPPRHTLTAAGVQQLHAALDELEGDRDIRVLVLTGGCDGVFVAHYEVGELAASAEQQTGMPNSAPKPTARLHPLHTLCLRLEALAAVTVAALNGNAAGGGCELSLACDFRLMADGPYHYGLPETSVGIIPGAGGTQRFARLLGTARALDLILHAQVLTPGEALELGLLHRVYPEATFPGDVAAFAADLAGRAPLALAAAKEAIRRGAEKTLEAGLGIEQECFDRTMRSKDAAGAMRAWLDGRAYTWQGE